MAMLSRSKRLQRIQRWRMIEMTGQATPQWQRTVRMVISRVAFGLCLIGTAYAQVIAPPPSGVQSIQPLPRQGSFIDSETLQPVIYPIPGFAVIYDVLITPQNDAFFITLSMKEALPPNTQSRGRMAVEVWFRSRRSEGTEYDRAVVYVAGSYEYASVPALSAGQAGVVDWNWNEMKAFLRAHLQVTNERNQIHLTVPSEWLMDYRPVIAVVRYLPSAYDLERVGTGLGGCLSSYHLLDEQFLGYSIPIPPFPEPLLEGDELMREDGRRFSIPPRRRGQDIKVPDTVPPRKNWPRPGDIDNDGDNDYNLDVDQPVAGLIMVDIWITDDGSGSAYVLVIGKDENGNGKLDPDEIWYPIGECPNNPGVNEGKVGRDGKIYWISFLDDNKNGRRDPTDGNGQLDPGERQIIYIFIPETGTLVVIVDPDGPGPKPPREVYRGDPNGYSWQF